MSTAQLDPILRHLRKLVAGGDLQQWSDRQLLDEFAASRGEAAFAALVARHGPLVLRVCRRVLGHEHDAEDAFQATFLVLARSAGSIRKREAVADFLHGVAYRTAMKAKRGAARRRAREERRGAAAPNLPASPTWDEVQAVLDEELRKLAEPFRAAFVLRVLEGKSGPEAAAILGCKEGTVSSRLTRARQQLQRQLSRRGIDLATLLAALAIAEGSQAALPATLAQATVRFGLLVVAGEPTAQVIPSHIAALAAGVTRAMLLTKLKIATVTILLLALAGLGAGVLARPGPAPREDAAAKELEPPPVKADEKGEADKGQADIGEMRGTWTKTETVTVFRDGKLLPPRQKKVTLVISDNKLIILGDDGLTDQEMAFTLNPTQTPKAIDLVSPRLGTLMGIYQLEGDTLKIHISAKEGQRPTEFPAQGELLWDLKRVSRTPAKAVSRFPNAPGCSWMVEPISPPSSMATLGIVFIYEKDRDGAALITLAGALPGHRRPEYRPVLLDAGKKRYLPEPDKWGGLSGRRDGTVVALSRWRMDPKVLPAEKVALVGIEELTAEFRRAAAREALERARQEGVEVLPYPEIGQAFDFALTTTEGKTLHSRDLRGKVIVIDCWATWCAPCMTLLPEVKSLYQKWHKDGLEVIGINFDNDAEKVKKTCQRLGLDWPQVLVPRDDKQRELWQKASGIGSIPRLLVIDREGILRLDLGGALDEESIAKLLKRRAEGSRP